jgi:predicted glycoside hydrolase/deacetylase ChbG (UPF0249 family)/glycosyltransferase involved in cell wall biosynthesis
MNTPAPTKTLRYALITPARNEEDFIELTLKSVVAQTQLPERWVIVSDGSTDGTDEIVKRYSAAHDWIELLRMPERAERHFSGKVACIQAAIQHLDGVAYDIVGNLDADMSFGNDVFEFLMGRFAANPRLGVAGAPFTEGKGTYEFRFSSIEHVSGACQLFRKECFEAIGGYTPIKGGGIDVVAVLTARMRGWETRTFPEKSLMHHRPMGTALHGAFSVRFKLGQKDYNMGRDFLWQTFRSAYQMTRPPYVVGGAALWCGYVWSALKRVERPVSREIVEFQRQDQMQRLKRLLLPSRFLRPRAGARGALPTAPDALSKSPDLPDAHGLLIINADDWGGWRSATDAAVECLKARRITSVSAMVFMDDSERAAAISRSLEMDVGLHINLNQSFTSTSCPRKVVDSHEAVRRFLRAGKYTQVVYNPRLRNAFRTVFQAQTDEFCRLYGRMPSHYDGHHHMHLCANMLWGDVIPAGQKVRRSFSFWPGEKSLLNRLYRSWVDNRLQSRQITTDYFFSLAECLRSDRLSRVVALAKTSRVELMAHPEKTEELEFLLGDRFGRTFAGLKLGGYSELFHPARMADPPSGSSNS